MSNSDRVKKFEYSFFIIGSVLIISGIVIDNAIPWSDQITLTKMGNCIADMHFRHNNETQFQECISPDLKKIETLQ